jgi:hypothetical protein
MARRRRDSWRSSSWGGGDGWGNRARLKTNYQGWLQSSKGDGWGRPLDRMGNRLSNAEWGKRAQIKTALSGSYQGRERGGIRSAWGSNEPARGTDSGWFASAVVDGPLSALMPDGGGRETEPPDPDEQPKPQLPDAAGPGPDRDRIIGLEDLDALREQCVDEVAALALRLAAHDDEHYIVDRLAVLIGAKYTRLVAEWAGEHAAPSATTARAFASVVVEAAMYDRREREPFAWKIYRFIRGLFNGKTETETTLQVRATSTGA